MQLTLGVLVTMAVVVAILVLLGPVGVVISGFVLIVVLFKHMGANGE